MNTPDWLIRLITVGRDLALVLGQIGQNAFVEHIFCFLDLVGGCRLEDFLRSSLCAFRRGMHFRFFCLGFARSGRRLLNLVSDVLRLDSGQVRIGQERIQNAGRLGDAFALQHDLDQFAAGARRQFEPRLFRHRWVGKQSWQQDRPQVFR